MKSYETNAELNCVRVNLQFLLGFPHGLTIKSTMDNICKRSRSSYNTQCTHGRGAALLTPNVGFRWGWVINVTPRTTYPITVGLVSITGRVRMEIHNIIIIISIIRSEI